MDCERRSAVDDDRSRKTRLAVDDDRRQGRWAVDDARSRIAFYQAQSKESLDRVDRNLDLIRENLRAIRKMRMSSATIPRYSSSSSSISSSASRRRSQPYHDYPPLELPLRWRDPPPRYPPLDRPMRWPDPSSDRAVRNHPRSGFNNSYPFEHHPPPVDMNLCTPPASSTPIPPHDSPAFSMLQQNALTGPTADLLHSSMPAAATVEAEDSSVVHVLSAQVSIRSTQSLHHLSPVKSRPISRFRSESPARSLSQAVEFRHNRRRKTQIYNGENIHTTVYMNVDGEEMSKDDEDDSEVDLEMSEDDDEEEGKDFWWSPDPGGTIQLPLPLSPCEPKSSQASIGTALPLPLLPPLPLSLNFLNPMPDSVSFDFCVKQEISANTHPQFSRVINELNERSIMVRFLSGRGSLSSRPVDEEEADEDSEEKLMLKPLHWDQVKESFNQAMVLVKPKSSSFQMIEALFVNNSTAPLPKEQSRRVILPSWKKEDRVLAPKKLQNIATLLRALNDTRKEVSEILLHENTNKLATGFFETLVQMAHKKEVQFKFRNFNGDISKIKLHSIDIVLTNFGVNQDDGYFCNSLIGLHVRCKDIVYARKMFDELHERDVVSWINMIVGYIQNGDVLGSFRLFHEIRTSGIEPNSVALVVVIRAFEVKEIVDGMKTGSRLLREKVSLVLSAKFSCHSHKLARQWLRKPSNEYPGTDLCKKISLLAIVEQGGKEKANLLQHAYEDEMTEEFDPKLWICVSKNFDMKSHWSQHVPEGASLEAEWNAKFAEYEKKYTAELKAIISGALPAGCEKALPTYTLESYTDVTRNLFQQCINALASALPDFLGGIADLVSFNMILLKSFVDFQKTTPEERNMENKIFDPGI